MSVINKFSESRPILDGTGADGAFGLASKLRFYRIAESSPGILLDSISAIYKTSELWKSNQRLERFGRIVRRCAQLPIFLAAIARNPLADIAYKIAPGTREDVLEGLEQWISASCPSTELGFKAPVADLAINCSRVLAQKTKSPLDFFGRVIKYPFLDERMVQLAMGRALKWPQENEPKWVLKALLADYIPNSMVYRQKSGFVGPYREILSRQRFISSLDRVIEEEGELSPYLHHDVIRKLREQVRLKRQLPGQTYWFLWAITFVNNWLAGPTASQK
jgi:hypothetical protein